MDEYMREREREGEENRSGNSESRRNITEVKILNPRHWKGGPENLL